MDKIWTFAENQNINTDNIDLKQFKPTGKFFDDVENLCKIYNIKVHPALKKP